MFRARVVGKYSPHKQYERLNVSGSVLGWAARCVVCFCTSVVHRLLLCVPRRPTLALVEVQQLSLFSSLGKRHAHVRGAGAVRHHMSAVASLASCMAYAMAIVVRGGNSGTAVLRALILVLGKVVLEQNWRHWYDSVWARCVLAQLSCVEANLRRESWSGGGRGGGGRRSLIGMSSCCASVGLVAVTKIRALSSTSLLLMSGSGVKWPSARVCGNW